MQGPLLSLTSNSVVRVLEMVVLMLMLLLMQVILMMWMLAGMLWLYQC